MSESQPRDRTDMAALKPKWFRWLWFLSLLIIILGGGYFAYHAYQADTTPPQTDQQTGVPPAAPARVVMP